MLPLGSPSEAGFPCVQDLAEGSVERESGAALEEVAAARSSDLDRGELFQNGREVDST
jgi:hypothetical protein